MTSASSFPGVVGHERVQARLTRAILRGRLHHGLLIVGPRGVGKTTLALGLACALLCDSARGVGCGACTTCRRVLAGHHTDLTRLVGEGKSQTISVAGAREATLRAQHAPYERGAATPGHLVVVEPADRLQHAAAAALLKTLEEPPPGVYFALLATNEGEVTDTLRSRCLSLNLEGLADSLVEEVLDRQARLRSIALDPARRRLAIELAGGSPGIALALAGDASIDSATRLLAHLLAAIDDGAQAIFGGDATPLWSSWKEAVLAAPEPSEELSADAAADAATEVVVVKGKLPKGQKRAKKARADADEGSDKPSETPAKQRAVATRLAELWMIHLRDRSRGGAGLVDSHSAGRTSSHALARQMRAVQQFQAALARNPNVRLALEDTLLRLAEPTATG